MKIIFTLGLLFAAASVNAQLADAKKLTDNEQFEKATSAFKQIVKATPGSGEAWFYLGENYFANNRPDSAEMAYRKGIAVDPSFPLNYAGYGKIFHERGSAAEADVQFELATAAALTKANKFGKSEVAATYREEAEGLLAGKTPNYDAALALLDAAIKLNPKDAETYIVKGDALFERNPRDGSAPLENYKKAMELDPLNAKPVARKAFMYYRAKNFPVSIEEYGNAIALDPSFAPAYRGRAEAYFKDRKFEQATADMNKYLELNSGNTSARVRNAQFLFVSKDYAGSLAEINDLEVEGVDNVVLKRIKAYDLVEQGDTLEALAAFDVYFAAQDTAMILGSDLLYLGKALLLAGKDSLAAERMMQGARMEKENAYLYVEAAKAFTDAKAYDKAVAAMQAKVRAGQPEVNDWYYLGAMANRAKQYSVADSAWAEYTLKQPDIFQGYLYRARSRVGMDTSVVKTWSAKPFYEETIRKMKPEEIDGHKADLEEAYNYMGLYFLYDKEAMDRSKAKCWFEKVSALNAGTSITQQVNDTFLKMKELKDVKPTTCDMMEGK